MYSVLQQAAIESSLRTRMKHFQKGNWTRSYERNNLGIHLCCAGLFLSTRHKHGHIWEEEISTEKLALSDWPIGKSVRCFLD